MTWHAEPDLILRYAEGTLGEVGASSLEAHVLSCEQCRRAVSDEASVATLERVWADTTDRIDVPRRGIVERLLTLVGLPGHIARVIAITGALQVAWLAALAGVAALAVVAADERPGALLFLVIAPLVPVAGVALSFSTVSEPGKEMARATPIGGLRLLLYRAGALSVTAFVVLALGSLALPTASAALWVLPALALTAATLAAGTWFDPVRAAVTLGLGWILGLYVVVLVVRSDVEAPLRDPSLLLTPTLQVAALGVFAACSALFVLRRGYVELRAR